MPAVAYRLLFCFIISTVSVLLFPLKGDNPLITEIELTKGESTYRYLYYYNENGDKTLETKWISVNGGWQKKELTEWIYTKGVCTEQHLRIWKDNDWQPEHLILFEYQDTILKSETHVATQSGASENIRKTVLSYSGERLADKIEYSWKNNNWQPYSEIKYLYNEGNLPDTLHLRNFGDNIPVSESKIIFYYNDLNLLKSIRVTEKEKDDWINSSLVNYYYIPDSSLKSSEIRKIWDRKYSVWKNSQHIEYRYDASGRLSDEVYQHWGGTFWVNDLQYGFQYNEDGLLTKKTTFLPIYNDFRPAWSVLYSDFRYAKANLIEAKNEFWGGEKGESYNTFIPYLFNSETVVNLASRIEIRYIPVDETGVTDMYGVKNQINVYPNPSKAIFYFNSEIYDVTSWAVTDLSGKIIQSKEQKERSGVIDLGNSEPGIYFLKVITPEGVKTQKLIKEAN